MRAATWQVPGMDLDGVMKGIDYLLNLNLGYKVELGRRIVSSAAATSPWTWPAPPPGAGKQANTERNLSIVQALDVARSAVRFGAREVTVCCLESEAEMPAALEEVEEAAHEGIRFLHRVGPQAGGRRGRAR